MGKHFARIDKGGIVMKYGARNKINAHVNIKAIHVLPIKE